MRGFTPSRAALLCAALIVAGIAPVALAQTPPYYPPPPVAPAPPPVAVPAAPVSPAGSEIAACLCLRRDITALGAKMSARRQSYDEVRRELGRMDARLERERSGLDVNNPGAVAHFRQLLGERDAMFRRSTGPAAAELSSVTARYNQRSSEYNARCANRPQDSALVAQVQATLACPAPY